MKNPFVVTGVAGDPAFCNRQQEQEELSNHIENAQNVLIFSHRRYGKTSLILKVFNSLDNISPVYVDLYGTTSVEGFIKALIKGASILEPKSSRFIRLVKETISGLSISFGFDPVSQSPNVSASFDRQPVAADLEAVFHLVQRTARDKRMVIAFDEFQEVDGYGAASFEKELRKIIQHHDSISYLFAGSQRHIMASMFNDATRALYQLAISMPLGRIATEDYVDWIQALYDQGGKPIDDSVIRDVVARCDNHPKYVQEFFYNLWPAGKLNLERINTAENAIIGKRSVEFMNIWDSLSLNQKKTMKLLARTKGVQLFSADNLSTFQLKTASQVTAAIKVLEQRELVSKNGAYRIYDPVFCKWIERIGA